MKVKRLRILAEVHKPDFAGLPDALIAMLADGTCPIELAFMLVTNERIQVALGDTQSVEVLFREWAKDERLRRAPPPVAADKATSVVVTKGTPDSLDHSA